MIRALLDSAWKARREFYDEQHTSAWRLFNGFLEGCPALCMDVYARTLILNDYAADPSASQAKTAMAWVLENLPWIDCIILKDRNAASSSQKRGTLVYGHSPARKIVEHGTSYALDLMLNRDASFYLDTRNLRAWAQANLTGKTVLNAFAYTGSLGVAALVGGASRVVQLDRNQSFLNLARESCALNGLSPAAMEFVAQDFFPAVASFKRSHTSFDCVFLDPPYFASSSKGTVDLESGSSRLINKVRPLINDDGWLVAINNALFVSGRDYLASLETLCSDDYLTLEENIPVPVDITGYAETIQAVPPADPTPFNHSTKIAVLHVRRKNP